MRRKTFDALMTIGGLVLAAVLIVAAVLLLWAHNFIDKEVHSQLAQQKVVFPAAGSAVLEVLFLCWKRPAGGAISSVVSASRVS